MAHTRSGATHPHSPIGGLTQWLMWFTAMATAAAVIIGIYVVSGNADAIMAVIVVLFLVTISKSFLDIFRLEREARLASRQIRDLQDVNDIRLFLEQARPSIFRTHIDALHTIFLVNPDVRQDNLIEIRHARLMAGNRVVELLASILITLGLIGTIIGLIAVTGGLSGVLQAAGADLEDVKGALEQTVTGMYTAFNTTLLGAVFGGVVLRILTSVVDANIMRYVAHLAELTEVHVLPAMRRTGRRLEARGYYENGRERDQGVRA